MKLLSREAKKGFLLISSYVFILLIVAILVTISVRLIVGTSVAVYQSRRQQARYLAWAGVERAKTEMYNAFMNHFYGPTGAWTDSSFEWFDSLLGDAPPIHLPIEGSLPTGTYQVDVISVQELKEDVGRVVKVRSIGRAKGVEVMVVAWLWYGLARSKVFDYAYFINNYGWFWGSTITANGDVRSNGDFSLKYSPKVNGDVYAGVDPDLGSSGTIDGTNLYDTLSDYYSTAPLTARPGNPSYWSEDLNGNGVLDPGEDVNGNGYLDTYEYDFGYDGTSTHYEHQVPIEMPYLGDLNFYKTVANLKGGKIVQGGTVVVDGVHEGNLILVGTETNPIEITGPVVISGDVVIKGKVKGQGVIYAGRNIHILGNVEYVDPPSWPKPDDAPEETDQENLSKDFLGLAAKGNVIIGDYTSSYWNTPRYYISSAFTSPYKVDPTDATNGYVKYYDAEGNPWFDGDYTAYDGGKKEDGSLRRYYESSFPDATIRSLADRYDKITRIDAFIYTNHAIAGRIGAISFNGGIVARDEALIYSGHIIMNYDVRVRDRRFRDKFYLPRDLALPKVWTWEEK